MDPDARMSLDMLIPTEKKKRKQLPMKKTNVPKYDFDIPDDDPMDPEPIYDLKLHRGSTGMSKVRAVMAFEAKHKKWWTRQAIKRGLIPRPVKAAKMDMVPSATVVEEEEKSVVTLQEKYAQKIQKQVGNILDLVGFISSARAAYGKLHPTYTNELVYHGDVDALVAYNLARFPNPIQIDYLVICRSGPVDYMSTMVYDNDT